VTQSTLHIGVNGNDADAPREIALLFPVALIGAGVVTALTFSAQSGINWLLSCVTALAALSACAVRASQARPALGRLMAPRCIASLALAVVLASSTAITSETVLNVLAILCALLLGSYLVLVIGRHPGDDETAPQLVFLPFVAGKKMLAEVAQRTGDALTGFRIGPSTPVVRGVALAMPVFAVLFLLLSAADPILDIWRATALELLKRFIAPARLTFFCFWTVALIGAGGLALRCSDERNEPDQSSREAREGPAVLSGIERLIVLGSMIGVFTLFFTARLSEIFGDIGTRSDSGVTLAEATHRGFIELTIAATLAASVIMGLDRTAQRGQLEGRVNVCADIVIAQAFLLLISAYHRVALYEAVYGYTVERLVVQIYCVVVGAGLGLLAIELHRGIDPPRLLRRCGLVLALTLAALCFWNPAGWIAEQNLARYVATGKIDADYLADMARGGSDAIPALTRSLPLLRPQDAQVVRDALAHAAQPLESPDHWYEWNARRERARSALRAAGIE
jgi:hypothetical protein